MNRGPLPTFPSPNKEQGQPKQRPQPNRTWGGWVCAAKDLVAMELTWRKSRALIKTLKSRTGKTGGSLGERPGRTKVKPQLLHFLLCRDTEFLMLKPRMSGKPGQLITLYVTLSPS